MTKTVPMLLNVLRSLVSKFDSKKFPKKCPKWLIKIAVHNAVRWLSLKLPKDHKCVSVSALLAPLMPFSDP